MTRSLTAAAIRHPKLTIIAVGIITVAFLMQLPRMKTDTDPKHMLPATSPVRVYNDQVLEWFQLHDDVIVVGIVNDKGVLNLETLGKIARLTEEILKLPGVIARDVASFTTVDNIVADGENLTVKLVMEEVPKTAGQVEALRRSLFDNPLFLDRLISRDGKATAIYVPIEPGANGKEIADRIRGFLREEKGDERYYLAGDPVARDTFGAEMFMQMGLFSPIAAMVILLALYIMFRNIPLVISNMAVMMVSVIWSMGLLISLKLPVHIMSSMIPVFLMAISTDSVHIFNEFYFRMKEVGEKKAAILDTMRVVGGPVIYSDLTTAVGFASLAAGAIIPVRVFGLFVAFGTLVILLMSFTLIPAVLMLAKEERLLKLSGQEDVEKGASGWLLGMGRFSVYRSKAVVGIGLLLLLLAVVGIRYIRVNNNMVSWFKPKSEVRLANTVMNKSLGGTATAYLVATAKQEDAMKRPEVLKYLEGLQRELERNPLVGKTLSVADYVKRINLVIHQNDPKYEVIPDSREVIGQYLFLFSASAKPSDLNNVVDYPFQKANIWLQLKSWDAVAMRDVLDGVRRYTSSHPSLGLEFKPAGIAYFNMVWNDEVLWGMLQGFILSAILVFFLLALDFRSFRWGLISFLPLLFTIVLIYGVVGFVGKDFDMPVSVLSTLSLGIAIDFAIHFVSRFKRRYGEEQKLNEALLWTAGRPGKGIIRNAILFALGFGTMVFAALTPYITVGAFMIAIMLLSAIITLLYLPALIKLFPKWLLKVGPGKEVTP